jgi:hypothetical protein
MLAEDTFQAVNAPVGSGQQRASGLRLADPRTHTLFHAILAFRLLADGFRAADLRNHLAGLTGCDPNEITQGAITYQLRRLRLHGLIERISGTFRYRVTTFGFRVALFFTRAYNRILRPGLAAALPRLHSINPALSSAFHELDDQLDQWTEHAKLSTAAAAYQPKPSLTHKPTKLDTFAKPVVT